VSCRVDPTPALIYHPAPRPAPRIDAAWRAGTEDSRRGDAGRAEPRVDAFRAGPGAVPFPAYLRALNAVDRIGSADGHDGDHGARPSAEPVIDAASGRAAGAIEPPRDPDLPRLGDISPVAPEPEPDPKTAMVREVYLRPATTGRLIDVVI